MKSKKSENYIIIEKENCKRPIIIVNNDLDNKPSVTIIELDILKSINKLKEEF